MSPGAPALVHMSTCQALPTGALPLDQRSPSRIEEDRRAVAGEVKDFLERSEGSALRAWIRHFDTSHDHKISLSEFVRGMRKLSYNGDIASIFTVLDHDHSQELSLEEIDEDQASLWRQFRIWAVQTFESAMNMIWLFGGSKSCEKLQPHQFIEGLQRAGWEGGQEDLLFDALDIEDTLQLSAKSLQWLEIEKRRHKRKETAKRKAFLEKARRAQDPSAGLFLMNDFKHFLKRRYGHFVRAWRNALSPDGSMVLHQADLFKACTAVGWQGDKKVLWQALDRDGSGSISIEELDPKSAVSLAHFRVFVDRMWGSMSVAFRALDKYNTKKLRLPEFVSALQSFGFQYPAKGLFHGLDREGTKSIVEEDLYFLDKWKPPAFLVAQPNKQAMEQVKIALINAYKNYLKAWRHALDIDSSNRCNWGEFEETCRKIEFTGDAAGAWRALDHDLSGFITLQEIDQAASDILMSFKRWADIEFGGVRSAFGVFDSDGSNEVTYREFRRSCRIYGYEGNVRALFLALDVERNGALSIDEVIFLDEWGFGEESSGDVAGDGAAAASADEDAKHAKMAKRVFTASSMTEYHTDGPGPGAYSTCSSIGAGPAMPMVRFSGAFSFRRRPRAQRLLPGLNKDAASFPSPCTYTRVDTAVVSSKPSWVFGSEVRQAAKTVAESTLPGPGAYSPTTRKGIAYACTPRRPLRIHPLFTDRSTEGPWTARF